MLLRFGRPHTIVATAVQVVSLWVITGGRGALSLEHAGGLGLTLGTSLALNLYVVGLNQITDLAVDRINKPGLPLADGTLGLRQAWLVVALAGLAALLGAAVAGRFLMLTVLGILVIGSAYSLPPLRLRRSWVWAALSIALARGLIANLGLALHFQQVLGEAAAAGHVALAVLTAFFFGFGLVIAIYKDLPDTQGDRLHGIQSFALRFGPRRALGLGRSILACSYAGVALFALARWRQPAAAGLLLAQLLPLAWVWRASARVALDQPAAVARFYRLLWQLFYAQYLVLGLYQLAQGPV